ncbi:MAG TPA: hypothetical protein VGA69_07135 [Nitriliruptorales bacterium]
MGRDELRAALLELTASLTAQSESDEQTDDVPWDDQPSSEERAARLELLEELRGL